MDGRALAAHRGTACPCGVCSAPATSINLACAGTALANGLGDVGNLALSEYAETLDTRLGHGPLMVRAHRFRQGNVLRAAWAEDLLTDEFIRRETHPWQVSHHLFGRPTIVHWTTPSRADPGLSRGAPDWRECN